MKVGDKITVQYADGQNFNGEITNIEKTSGDVVWGDGSTLTDRTMIRIKTEKGYYRSFYLDKCVSIKIN